MLDELEGWHANTLEKRIGISQGLRVILEQLYEPGKCTLQPSNKTSTQEG